MSATGVKMLLAFDTTHSGVTIHLSIPQNFYRVSISKWAITCHVTSFTIKYFPNHLIVCQESCFHLRIFESLVRFFVSFFFFVERIEYVFIQSVMKVSNVDIYVKDDPFTELSLHVLSKSLTSNSPRQFLQVLDLYFGSQYTKFWKSMENLPLYILPDISNPMTSP